VHLIASLRLILANFFTILTGSYPEGTDDTRSGANESGGPLIWFFNQW
jgi:hypothetical protein